MRGKTVSRRLRLGLAAAVVLAVATGLLVASAGAAVGDGIPVGQRIHNPQQTNVAQLAWRGEELRFVKCDPLIPASGLVLPNAPGAFNSQGVARANLWVEDFSAPNNTDGSPVPWPQGVTGTFQFFHSTHQNLNCIRGDFESDKAGLAKIKLVVTDSTGQVKYLEHQFLGVWMAINSATMTNAGARPAELPGSQTPNDARVLVTGRVPINSEFQADWGLPANLVLPNDWARLATSGIASTDVPLRQANPSTDPSQYWDIHDSSSPIPGVTDTADVHVAGYCPGGSNSNPTDQVDNCVVNMAAEFGLFSRIFTSSTPSGAPGSGVGPYDPNYAETLLSDGLLNAADAPMPPLRVDFSNSGPFGAFVQSPLNDKHIVYSRDGLGSNTAHNLYAPYYGAFIPATSRAPFDDASGTDGPYLGSTPPPGTNNFEGYLVYGRYHFWNDASVLRVAAGGPSPCILTGDRFRPLNSGNQAVAVYTDEHGEARVSWLPGLGNDNFGTSVGFVDINRGCDLEGVNLGSSTISAVARYPFQNVANPTPVAGTVVKSLLNRFHKDVTCVKKNNVSTAIAYICTASATDITGGGLVFNGEQVCFSREPDNVWFDIGGINPQVSFICRPLAGGTATAPATVSVETPATLGGTQIDVQASFTGEHLLRDTCITVGVSPSAPGPCGAVGGGTTGTTTGTTTTGTTTTGTTSITTLPTVKTIVTAPKAKAFASVVSVQIVATRNGRVLMVKIHSPKKSAKIQVRLINAKGKVVSTVVRTVKTNKRVQVPNLKLGAYVKTVRVRLVS